ncbi:glycine betaine ABC transporter substrate-binding protein [Desulfocurvibacter africanus]|uniref:ABC-type glycine betaine transport, periplasmic subunit n=1 Tax=Desulfocurvibacter africanus subsp. africanus str. Walvis Bay TaxID=690850 RepID=F3YZV0_DESAF|nr:glycine betaine ABC transporter substrate-binding protein [Desulfocurvibacter africanus]EGJ50905.1 ABC-type glycine betaine transport, periplasmic subunit [Desulfocurvibacter africanus subsp. africanus str. Walvis Bay]
MRFTLKVFLTAMAVLLISAPSAFAAKKVTLAYVEWDCAVASTNVARAVLQEKLGYDVEILPVAAAAMWQAVATGDVDGMVTAWLPETHKNYADRLKGKFENLGPIVGGAKLGWAVPKYVDIDSIADLNKHADKFDGRVYGIDPGAGLMQLSEKAMEEYKLNKFELMEGSGATMTAALADAIKNKQWVVVTAWSPHWMFGRWELKYLDDPKGILGGEEHIDTIVRKGLKQDMPKVYAFMDRFQWDSPDQLQMVMAWNQEPDADPYKNAVRFINENPKLVNGWLGK